MWQAYYAKERVRLFALLVTMLHEQNHYSRATATRAGFHLARAAATFGDARGDYERVLPDLENAYRIAKNSLRAGFDPAAVARAELAWWVARRTPGEASPERVGGLMADAYALLYEAPRSEVARSRSPPGTGGGSPRCRGGAARLDSDRPAAAPVVPRSPSRADERQHSLTTDRLKERRETVADCSYTRHSPSWRTHG